MTKTKKTLTHPLVVLGLPDMSLLGKNLKAVSPIYIFYQKKFKI